MAKVGHIKIKIKMKWWARALWRIWVFLCWITNTYPLDKDIRWFARRGFTYRIDK